MHHHAAATGLTDHQIATIAVNSVFPAIAALFIGLRLWAKRIKHTALLLDDWLILLGFVFVLGNSMPYIYAAVQGGMGEHLANLTSDQMTIFGLVTFWTQFPYIFAVAIIKFSILAFYRSVFSTPKFKLATKLMSILLALWMIAFFFATLFQAWPISYNWQSTGNGYTINEGMMYNALACTELITDAMILVMPLFVIWTLQLKASKKWAISGIFLLGGFVCIASAFRIYYFTTTIVTVTQDFTYDTYGIFIWTGIEPCMGVICACLPCLGPLFKEGRSTKSLFGSARSYFRGGSAGSKNSKNSGSSLTGQRSHGISTSPVKASLARGDDGLYLVETSASYESGKEKGITVVRTFGQWDERRSRMMW